MSMFDGLIERRSALEFRATGNRIGGYAAVFDKPSGDLGGFKEKIAQGAFTRTLAEKPDVVGLYDHDARAVLGRTTSGTLQLEQDERGLKFELDVANTTTGRDVLEMVKRGDVTGASFAFSARSETWEDSSAELPLRILQDVDLFDITITPMPAYGDTQVALRTLQRHLTNSCKPYFRAYAERELSLMDPKAVEAMELKYAPKY